MRVQRVPPFGASVDQGELAARLRRAVSQSEFSAFPVAAVLALSAAACGGGGGADTNEQAGREQADELPLCAFLSPGA